MSSILKALKKLEEEKARQEQGKVDIATDILRSSGRQTSSRWSLVLLMTVLVLAGIAGGIYVTRSVMPSPVVEPVVMPSPPSQDTVRAAEVAVEPPSSEATLPTSLQGPSGQALTEIVPAPADKPAENKPGTTPSAPIATPSKPTLVVSGIVYQEDPQNRMAVINDLPVMSGTNIDGAEVVEIQPDRVVFSFEGQRFSIILSDQP